MGRSISLRHKLLYATFFVVFGLISIGLLIFISENFFLTQETLIAGEGRAIRLKEFHPYTKRLKFLKHGDRNQAMFFETDGEGFIKPAKIHANPHLSIYFLGGSTTACEHVTPISRFAYKVGRLLEEEKGYPINSINSGVNENDSHHNINILVNKLYPMKPDVVVLMNVVNDFNVLMKHDHYVNQGINTSTIIPYTFNLGLKPLKRWMNLKIPVTYNRIRYWRYLYQVKTVPNLKKRVSTRFRENAKPDPQRMRAHQNLYRQNLRAFISIARSYGTLPVLMTQAHRKELMLETLGPEYYEVYTQYNQIVREIGEEQKVSVVDLDGKIPHLERYMYDHVHYTDEGSLLAASIISESLSQSIDRLVANKQRGQQQLSE